MRTPQIILIAFGIWILSTACQAGEAGVMVTKLEKGVPVTQVETNDLHTSKMWRMWEKQTPDLQPENPREWRTLYSSFSNALVTSANQAGLHSSSLQELLKRLLKAKENKGLAVLPVAAHQTYENGEAVWVIALKWEGEAAVKEGDSLAHMRVFTFNQKTLKQTGFVTCG
jgi:hypothetical protein